ncbi:MAG: amino acid adenylation domain-containing protein [Candidatus Aminicenantes bacterium]|nr:MAG: amino acid adenylation domain-containing protein [Candidatus Aminicenantes bacterium]
MSDLKENNSSTGYEIAVIGMAGRFPGSRSIDEFWENLKNGNQGIGFFTDEELEKSGVSPQEFKNPRYVKAKGMLEDVDYFDASFFNYTLPEAEMMDPQLRILHECCWKALEDAGYNPEIYQGFIGFYCGANIHFYWMAMMMDRARNSSELFGLMSVNDNSLMSTQVAYRLNLKGPVVTLQTACSTSLVAVHMGCQALLSGECDIALAGGTAVNLPIKSGYLYQEGMIMSSDGHCRAFDAKASGTTSGEGVGIVVLKPLENAIADQDHIYALVKGTAVNNDGNRRVGYSAPSIKGQAEVIRIAQQAANVEPESITYIEAHGTGTPLGDPVEIRALVRAFDTDKKQFCRIGSVKSNIGHLDAAAGVAGFIKTVLAIHHRMIPPSLHFENPNPEVDFENSPFVVNTGLCKWTGNGFPLRAGVSSFGIGGTNAHVVLEEPPGGTRGLAPSPIEHTSGQPQLILLSAKTEAALERNTQNLVEFLKNNPGMNLADTAYTLQVGRKAFAYRRALVCQESAEAAAALSAAPGHSKKVRTLHVLNQNPKIVFMFPGLGSQYTKMGYDLYQDEPIFRDEMNHCFEILKPLLDYDIKEILYPSDRSDRSDRSDQSDILINQTEIAQVVIFSFEYALAALLMKWGITPHAMIGYSFGEYTAACRAGVFTLEQALRLIIHRGKLMDKTPQGGMLSVPLSRKELMPLLPGTGELSLAIDNGPSCIIAGSQEAIDAFAGQLKQKKYLCMRLNTCHAIHSPLMNSILAEFAEKVKEIPLKEPQIPYISNLTGQWLTRDEATDPGYWVRHLASPVRFSEGIDLLVKEPQTIFVELGPGRDLSTLIQRSLDETHRVINLVRPQQKQIPDTTYLLERLGRLWLFGKDINWTRFYDGKEEGRNRYRVSLPTYSFERQRFALDKPGGIQPITGTPAITEKPTYTYKQFQLAQEEEAPRDELEAKIAESFLRIFGLESIGIHDDFFELGGDSLKVIDLVTGIHRELDVELPMEVVFRNPTVKTLANYIGKKAEKRIYSAIAPVEQKEYYPLSPAQQRVFIIEQIEEKGMAYNMPTATWMEGPLQSSRLEKAYHQMVRRHESLRTGFFVKDGEPVQRVYSPNEIEFALEFYDIKNPGSTDAEIEGIIENFVKPFDLSHPPLWQVGLVSVSKDKHLLLDMLHHIISDDISIGVLMTEVSGLYREETLQELPVQYKDYVVWQAEVAGTDTTLKEQERFWLDCFSDAGELPDLDLPFDYPRPELQSFEGAHIDRIIHLQLKEKLYHLARKNKTTLFVVLFTLYNTLLYTYTRQEDIIVGIPITGRSHRDAQEIVGMFVNTLALRNYPKGNQTFEEFLQEVKENILKAFSNQFYQFEDLVEKLAIPRDMSRNPLFDAMFVLHTVNLENIKFPGVKLSYYEREHPACRFDLTLNAAEFSEGINIGVEYTTALFKEQTMQRFLEHFFTITETVVENPQITLDEIPVPVPLPIVDRTEQVYGEAAADLPIPGEEKKKILDEFNNTVVDYPGEKTLKELFEDQAGRSPDYIALVGITPDDRHDRGQARINGHCALTYRQLNENTNQVARQLRACGAATETVVALMTDRTIKMLVGVLAVLKAGAAYLPIDPEYPADRVRYMVQHTDARIILTTALEIPFEHTSQVIDLTKEDDYRLLEKGDLPTTSCPGSLAYVIYTSGTTGKPKGVMIENRSVVNFIAGITAIIPFTGSDSILSLTTQGFDIFGLETLLPLSTGSRVVIGGVEEQLNAKAAAAVIEKEKITIFQVTPSRLQLFIAFPESAASIKRLNYLLVGGEAFPPHLLETVKPLMRQGGKVYNVYGPTETTIWSTIKDVSGENALNIGKPLANTRIYIIDKAGRLLPIGMAGELCISGHGVARGYWKDEHLTREKFVENSFVSDHDPDKPGNQRMYRTGDLAAWLPDGNIRFLGRIDHQVKIKGYRIEPAEIENQLLTHEKLKEAAVLAMEDKAREKYLCAYIVSKGEFESSQLREYLAKELPYYMIPSYFISIEKMPLTPSGKIDRKALASSKELHPKLGTTYIAPSTALEKRIADAWKKVLSVDKVGIDDNFLDIGGTSLKVIKVVSELNVLLKRDIPVVTLFRYSTIRSFANFLSQEEPLPQKRDRTDIKAKGRERINIKRNLKRKAKE